MTTREPPPRSRLRLRASHRAAHHPKPHHVAHHAVQHAHQTAHHAAHHYPHHTEPRGVARLAQYLLPVIAVLLALLGAAALFIAPTAA